MPSAPHRRVDLAQLRRMKAAGEKFAMLTAYDYPTAQLAQAAGVHALLVGDSLGSVLLGHETTRDTPLGLMILLAEAVRRGAPDVYLVGDMPYEAMAAGNEAVIRAALRFRDEAGCDAVKIEVGLEHLVLIQKLVGAGVEVIAHLGLRPQTILSADAYRAQARDEHAIGELVALALRCVEAGAAALLLEAVPNEASAAVAAAVSTPIVGCGAGPACDGHVVVTHDMLGLVATRPPRFVPVLASVARLCEDAMRTYVEDIATRRYPAPEHVYPMKRQPVDTPAGA
ncbi:MAG: 3-methyl-2-oxobutanoate hydroxymethyltransferase [Phycisphaerae bacterium]